MMLRRTALLILLLPLLTLAQEGNGRHTLNFREADIHTVILTVSEITGVSFVTDPRVDGKITVVSARPLDADGVYEVFLSVLRIHNLAAVPSGNVVKIVPEAVARQEAAAASVEPLPSGGPDEIVTRVLELSHVNAGEVVAMLRTLLPSAALLQAHPGSNTLVVSDRAANVARLEQILRRIDQSADTEVEVIALRHASAGELIRTLGSIGGADSGARLFADERTNSILLSGERNARLRLRMLVTHLDTPLDSGDTQVVYLRYARAEELVPVLESVARNLAGTGPAVEGSIGAIQAHNGTNSLIITAPPVVFAGLRDVIRQLDVRRLQVLIEAVVAEVSQEVADELGVQWQATTSNFNNRGVIGGTNFPGSSGRGGIGAIAADPTLVGGLGGLSLGYISGSVRLPGTDTEILRLGALVRALRGDVNSNILSTPSVVTLDHQQAQISVGQEVPFLQGEFTTGVNTGGNQVNPFRTVDRREVGLKLTVTPHINQGDSIMLDIEKEVSSLAPVPVGAVDLVTNKRTLSTTVMVRDGSLLVLGGLITDDVQDSVQRVPALGDIPLLGRLFRYRSTTRIKRNLMIFLAPRILRDEALEDQISSEKYNYIRAEQLDSRSRQGDRLYGTDMPLLPELRDFLSTPMPAEGDRGG